MLLCSHQKQKTCPHDPTTGLHTISRHTGHFQSSILGAVVLAIAPRNENIVDKTRTDESDLSEVSDLSPRRVTLRLGAVTEITMGEKEGLKIEKKGDAEVAQVEADIVKLKNEAAQVRPRPP
jgi:hypothetical protein